jgi:hypothetical protein
MDETEFKDELSELILEEFEASDVSEAEATVVARQAWEMRADGVEKSPEEWVEKMAEWSGSLEDCWNWAKNNYSVSQYSV